MELDPIAYDMPWRPNYEKYAATTWVGAAGVAMLMQQLSSMPPQPFYWMAGLCGAMTLSRIPQALKLHRLQKHLGGRGLTFMKIEDLHNLVEEAGPEQHWIGYGFPWENRHAQRVFEILKRDWNSFGAKKLKKGEHPPMGQPWIHGIEPDELTLMQPLSHAEGHSLIAGTTGSGKTRMFDLLISQAILRNEAVIIIDPKGDKELRDNARRACDAMGQPERFLQFNPAFPDESVRINPLRNFSRLTEISSRLAALISSEAGNDPFTSFGWQALNNISQGLYLTHDRPNLIKLRSYLEGGSASLVVKSVIAYSSSVMPDWESKAEPYIKKFREAPDERLAVAYMRFYREEVKPEHPSPEVEGLLSMFQHDATHFSKMVANLLPIMNMLTSGDLGPLLSPDPDDLNDTRPMTDSTRIINNKQVAYFGLDSLTDAVVGSAIGSILLSDLTSVAGDRYNFGVNNEPVNVFVDEAAEVLNDPFIQLLNKGRGARIRLFVATQTFADFTARLGSKEKALQVLGNINNIYALRIVDTETQEFIAENLPKTRLKHVLRTQGQNTDGSQPVLHGGNQGERLMEEEADLFPPQLLGMLPNLEYIAKISGGKIIKGRLPILTG